MADTPITSLADYVSPTPTDIIPVVSNPSTTPVTQKATLQNILKMHKPWAGKIAAAYGDGDPTYILDMMNGILGSPVNPTPTNITASVARISYFILPFNLTVNTIRYWGVGATTSVYHVSLYQYSNLARLMPDTTFSTTANAWGAIGGSLNISLLANTVYFLAVSVGTTGTTAGVRAFTLAPAGGDLISVLPSARPGDLDIDLGLVSGGLGQFAIASGALPNPAATLAVPSGWTGGMPAFFLDSV